MKPTRYWLSADWSCCSFLDNAPRCSPNSSHEASPEFRRGFGFVSELGVKCSVNTSFVLNTMGSALLSLDAHRTACRSAAPRAYHFRVLSLALACERDFDFIFSGYFVVELTWLVLPADDSPSHRGIVNKERIEVIEFN